MNLKRLDTPEDRAFWASVEQAKRDWEAQKPSWLRTLEARVSLTERIDKYLSQFLDGRGNNQPEAEDLLREARVQLATAEAERDALRGAIEQLKGYVQHTDECDSVKWDGPWRVDGSSGSACTCGLADLLPVAPSPEQ